MVGFLTAQDSRWKVLLESIEQWGTQEMREEDYIKAADMAGVQPILQDFQLQLYQYLNTYTDGAVAGMVLTHGDTKSF